jgi:integrase/recombinase XerD
MTNLIQTTNHNNALVKTERDLPPHITFEQFKTIYNGLAGDLHDQILCGLLWELGGRVNDIMNIRWKDINLDTKKIRLFVDKKDDTITLSFEEALKSDLKNYMMFIKPFTADFIFPSDSMTGHVSRNAAYEKVKRWGLKYLGLPFNPPGNLHPHMFRHGLAIYLLYNTNIPGNLESRLQMIAARLGHASTAITMKYYLVITPELQAWALKDVPMR